MTKNNKDQAGAQQDSGMSSPTDLRNTTSPRKAPDMPEDEAYKDRDPERDYAGPAKKDH